jgi:hypothetical protein
LNVLERNPQFGNSQLVQGIQDRWTIERYKGCRAFLLIDDRLERVQRSY